MTPEEFAKLLKDNHEKALAHAAAILAGPWVFDAAYPHLRGFVACKYLLEEPEMTTDDLIGLGDLSTEKLAGLRRGGLEYADKSVGCTTVASSVTKKVLLVLSLQKLLGLKLDPDQVAETATVSGLTKLILSVLKGA